MKSRRFYLDWKQIPSIACIIFGLCLLSINKETVDQYLGIDTNESLANQQANEPFAWMKETGVSLTTIQGDPSKCTDVIFMVDSRDPFTGEGEDDRDFRAISKVVESMEYITRTSSALRRSTCFAFVKISSPFIDSNGKELHPVWGRLPATALVMSVFQKADIFLYMDSDAILAFSDKTPTMMYNELAFDGYGADATMQHLRPGLIVNKPLTGWLCGECEKFGLGHGCFNTGVLLWHRANAEPILRAWWDSRNDKRSQNIFDPETKEGFHGWNDDEPTHDKMGEQNRLIYLFGSDPLVRGLVWPVPRQKSEEHNSESCPNFVDEAHTPCLQNDFIYHGKWNPSDPSCFISHLPDEKKNILEVTEMIMQHKED